METENLPAKTPANTSLEKSGKITERLKIVRRSLSLLTTTFHFSGDQEVLEQAWATGLEGLSEDEIIRGVRRALKEYHEKFLPPPAVIRELASAETWKTRGATGVPEFPKLTAEQRARADAARARFFTRYPGAGAFVERTQPKEPDDGER